MNDEDNMNDPEIGLGLNIPTAIPYEERMKMETADQVGLPREVVRENLENKVDEAGRKVFESVIDPEEIVERGRALQHNWIDRGLKLSCEGAGHPYHQIWKPRKQY